LVFGGFGSVVILYMPPPRKNKKTIRRRRRRCSRGGENSSQKKTINPHRPLDPKPSKTSFLGTRRQNVLSTLNKTRKRSPRDSNKKPCKENNDILREISNLNKELNNISIDKKNYTELQEYKKEIEKLMEKCHNCFDEAKYDTDSFCNVLIPHLRNINNKLNSDFHNL